MIARRELPFEIWDCITTILGKDMNPNIPTDSQPLEALSLACKAMVPICQKHIFSTLLLNKDPARSARFRRLVSIKPSLLLYVQKLRHMSYNGDNVDDQEIIQALIERFESSGSGLCSVALGFSLSGRIMNWEQLPSISQGLLKKLIYQLSVTELEISNVHGLPLSIFSGCTSLTHLTLLCVDFPYPSHHQNLVDIPVDLSSGPRLVYLKGGYMSDRAIERLLQPLGDNGGRIVNLTGLKELLILFEAKRRHVVWDVLQVTDTTLESLNLYVFEDTAFGGLADALLANNGTVSKLKRLLAVIRQLEDDDKGLIAELSKIAGANVLEEVSLRMPIPQDIRRLDVDASAAGWGRAFDRLITTPGSFPDLKLVSISIPCLASDLGDGLVDRVKSKQFPRLSRSEMVEFRFLVGKN